MQLAKGARIIGPTSKATHNAILIPSKEELAFWIVVMIAYSSSLGIRIALSVAFEVGPIIHAPFASEWTWRLAENQDQGNHVMEVARLKMVALAVGDDGGDDGEVVVMVLVDVVVAAAGLWWWLGAAAGGDDEEGGRLWLAAKVVEVRWGDGGRRDDDGYKVVV
ncbi:hypothetical protein Tco_1017605 [Tanacetum coccineum]|uniref:Uncharacterized protein n=1 Tax=Tanacetum coccineum TaxID=301880 RepID=A0ABQ5FRZ5_9ASTR